jgi:uncharacterized NAD(P)/FAD-binding protein YdhS
LKKVVVVGGGYSAAAFAVQLVRRTRVPLDISIVEPRPHLGRGLAYSTTDRDHRLNAPLDSHGIDPDLPSEPRQWCGRNGVLERDPECLAPGGQVFLRREDFGAYVGDMVAQHAVDARSGSRIHHVRDSAVSAAAVDGHLQVVTQGHGVLGADLVVVATGNPVTALRPPFRAEHAHDPRIIGNPLQPGCLDRIPQHARVLVVGGGLTALDVLSTLVRRGHQAEILTMSRRGLRPRSHAPAILSPGLAPAIPEPVNLVLDASVPEFIANVPATARSWLRALRGEIGRQRGAGHSWHGTFDAVRNVVWKIWPQLPAREQRRFLAKLRVYYDVHRFRMPPMNEALVKAAEQRGLIRTAAARLTRVDTPAASSNIHVEWNEAGSGRAVHADFDYVVNCTGLDHAAAARANPFLRSMLEQGLLRPHATGLGFDVGPHCEAIDQSGLAQRSLRVVGPPTAGVFGDPLGAVFIAAQVRRILPDVMKTLETPSRAS